MSNFYSNDSLMPAPAAPVAPVADPVFSNPPAPAQQPMSVGVAQENKPELDTKSRTRSSKTVLVVDDETGMRIVARAILESVGYKTDLAESGEEAIEKYRASLATGQGYDIVVMDLALPGGISGVEALGVLRELDAQVRVIACSGYLEANTREAALRTGFAGVLPKPYSADRLASVVKHALDC